jgi:Xaa-Pro aminopeptidase
MQQTLKPHRHHTNSKATCMNSKIDRLKKAFPEEAAYFAVFDSVNMAYFTGFNGAAALLIPKEGDSTLYVASTNFEQAKHEVKGVHIELLKRSEHLLEVIAQTAKPTAHSKLAVDNLSIERYHALAKAVGDEKRLTAQNNTIRSIRAVKTPDEVALIRKACKLADLGIKVACEVIQPGVSELEVAAEVEYAMRKAGSCGTAFDTIVASGKNSAFPHGTCISRVIEDSDLVVVDLGATVSCYRSDITRTITAGKPSEKQLKNFQAVKTAQDSAFQAIAPQVPAKKVDSVAREAIFQAGFDQYFVHNLGHGVGLEVHEAPVLSPVSTDILQQGNVVTLEPGIYICGFGGVRIEDTVLVTENGAEKLTTAPYRLNAR